MDIGQILTHMLGPTQVGPQGTQESVVPPWLQWLHSAFSNPHVLGYTEPNDGSIYLTPKGASQPSTVAHERVHSAQLQQPNQLSNDAVHQAMQPALGPPQVQSNPSGNGLSNIEIPAYLFTDPSRYSSEFLRYGSPGGVQDAMANYLDANARVNPTSAAKLDASMPPDWLRQYITSHPRPIGLPASGLTGPGGNQ